MPFSARPCCPCWNRTSDTRLGSPPRAYGVVAVRGRSCWLALGSGRALLAVAAGAFWAASVVFDLSQERWGFPSVAVEDGHHHVVRESGPACPPDDPRSDKLQPFCNPNACV